MTKRILLYGFYGIANAGNEAMLRAFCEPIRQALKGDVEFVVASRHPDGEYNASYGVTTVPNFEYESRQQAAGRWLRGLNPDDSEHYLAFVRQVAEVDLVVLGPGQFLVETGTAGMLKGALGQALAVVAAARLVHTPVYGLALACEDLESPWAKLVAQSLLEGMCERTFRDPRSVENLIRAGIQLPSYQVLGDLALAGDPAPASAARDLLDNEGIPARAGDRLAVAARNIYWLGLDQETHRQKMADTMALWLEADIRRDIIMVPQNVYDVDGDRDDDRAEARRILAKLPDSLRKRIYPIEGKYPAEALESIYGLADVTLSSRLHGAVFSCKQGTPPVMLAFMDKSRGFFRRIGQENCLIDLDANAAEIADQLEHFLRNRSELAADIRTSIAENQATSRQYAKKALAHLTQGGGAGERQCWARSLFG
ncbi:polysaccharide pyruvyl transferase family protein [Marinobacter sp. CA1]|uniref:polysaccharide pyruvyl transferase family protein n=1 Tax=Marinobacter sp. CA1 TaxID=2817656 RepID=UPI001D06CDD5|nr:polysaccharide pyruvyl transferase family protein [Marinobacter sp. CA1]UDL03795.1 polysaccharide pyruvyl transferase family protein [Marinobacter sp. CA1]